MKARISTVEIYHLPVRLKEPFIISLGPLYYADNVFVLIKTSDGLTGTGECSPFPSIHGETAESCMVTGRMIAAQFTGKDYSDIESLSVLMDKIIYGNTSIKSAFDIALYDLNSQKASVPLYKFLGGINSDKIITDYTISFSSKKKMAEDAKAIIKNGFQIIKVKLGGNAEEDIERMHAIREVTGDKIPLRVDANQGWTAESAIKILNALKNFNIQHCEEPVARWKFMDLPHIRKNSPVKIMADESCFDHNEMKRLITLNACDYVNVKLGKSSGIFKAIKMIKLAEENNIILQAGGFLESRLGFTATAHLSLSSSAFEFFDFDTPLMFSEDPVEGGIVYRDQGKVMVPDLPGVGVKLSNHYLKNYKAKLVENE
jgi:L-Ala-D/L-Glu epimerase